MGGEELKCSLPVRKRDFKYQGSTVASNDGRNEVLVILFRSRKGSLSD